MAPRSRPGERRRQRGRARARQRGVTYLALMLGVVIAGTTLAAAGVLWGTAVRRDREAELLFVGEQFRRAIESYRDQVPAGQAARFPRRLEDLLDDKRWPATRRHLRRIYVDPMTAGTDWEIVEAPGGGIAAVHSRDPRRPFKQTGFAAGYQHLEGAASYRDWVFGYPGAAAAAASAPLSRAGSAPGS